MCTQYPYYNVFSQIELYTLKKRGKDKMCRKKGNWEDTEEGIVRGKIKNEERRGWAQGGKK